MTPEVHCSEGWCSDEERDDSLCGEAPCPTGCCLPWGDEELLQELVSFRAMEQS